MIYSKFGSKLTPISKSKDAGDRVYVQVTADGSPDLREYPAGELKADEGCNESDQVVSKLPWKVVGSKVERRRQTLC
jgi:hypothetical protein